MTQADIIVELLAWAVVLSGYEMPNEIPIIHYRPNEHFVEKLCDGVNTKKDPCVARAYYNDSENAIIVLNTKYWQINKEWSPFERGIILHEIVHYLQHMTGKYDGFTDWPVEKLCEARKFRQIEAYQTQDKYMLTAYGARRLLPRYYDSCGYQ